MNGSLISSLIPGLEKALEAVQTLAPVSKALGGPDLAAIASLTTAVVAVGANVAARVEQGKIVASERDLAVIKAINTELALVNDELAKHIAIS